MTYRGVSSAVIEPMSHTDIPFNSVTPCTDKKKILLDAALICELSEYTIEPYYSNHSLINIKIMFIRIPKITLDYLQRN